MKPDGQLSAITSNAWLGKEYGLQFKKFLLDNFHIRYVVRSNAEHWFKDSQVSTVFFVADRTKNDEPTKFVTLGFKLQDYFCQNKINDQLSQIEEFYAEIDSCEENSDEWQKDSKIEDLFRKKDNSMAVCVVGE